MPSPALLERWTQGQLHSDDSPRKYTECGNHINTGELDREPPAPPLLSNHVWFVWRSGLFWSLQQMERPMRGLPSRDGLTIRKWKLGCTGKYSSPRPKCSPSREASDKCIIAHGIQASHWLSALSKQSTLPIGWRVGECLSKSTSNKEHNRAHDLCSRSISTEYVICFYSYSAYYPDDIRCFKGTD